ncbi:MAG: hypothetical protein K0R73_541 [Candidatus Midichloriaceae bacterium]|jgi:hypothetical protein|nr:hypothetical protein [Candidatus Midichloriaceae bacterium]
MHNKYEDDAPEDPGPRTAGTKSEVSNANVKIPPINSDNEDATPPWGYGIIAASVALTFISAYHNRDVVMNLLTKGMSMANELTNSYPPLAVYAGAGIGVAAGIGAFAKQPALATSVLAAGMSLAIAIRCAAPLSISACGVSMIALGNALGRCI